MQWLEERVERLVKETVAQMKADGMGKETFKEAIAERTKAILTGKLSSPHKYSGVECIAQLLAWAGRFLITEKLMKEMGCGDEFEQLMELGSMATTQNELEGTIGTTD